jgi:DNA repair photolyase
VTSARHDRRHATLAELIEQVFDCRMRWDAQRLNADSAAGESAQVLAPQLPGLEGPAIRGLLRTVQTPEFAGMTFHEVAARSALNAVPGRSRMPFSWTINPFRGCSHACVYCFARGTHQWLELDTGTGFDTQIVVKVNLVEVLRRELHRPSWRREPVAMGTNTDPYQRAEGRYRLMPGVISAFADSGTPLSILTKGTLLRRDLPLLASTAARVPIGLGMSIAIWDDALHRSLEPGAPSPRARLDVVRAARDRGLPCGVFLAPVLPWLTDSIERLDDAVGQIAEAGATGLTVVPLHLRPGAREWFFGWLEREHPELVPGYRRLYGRSAYVAKDYRTWLAARVAPLVRRHGLGTGTGGRDSANRGGADRDGADFGNADGGEPAGGVPGDDQSSFPSGSLPVIGGSSREQLSLL